MVERCATGTTRRKFAVGDPRGKQGREHPLSALLFLGLLAKISLTELQDAFAAFLSGLLQEKTLIAAVDGKTAKQIKDADGEPLLMLDVFVHNIKVTLAEWSVKGDKTNEPGCLKQHLGELLQKYPQLKILTGDAVYANRPLLHVLQKHHLDYVFQIKENQPEVSNKYRR